MHRLDYVLWLVLGLATIALSQLPGPAAHANQTCEVVKERRCDFKGNCKDEVKKVCTGLSGQGNSPKAASPRNAPPRPVTKSLAK